MLISATLNPDGTIDGHSVRHVAKSEIPEDCVELTDEYLCALEAKITDNLLNDITLVPKTSSKGSVLNTEYELIDPKGVFADLFPKAD